MTWAIRVVVLGALATATWAVYQVRTPGDADPAAVAALKTALDALPDQVGSGRYEGESYSIDEEIVADSGADYFASKLYRDKESPGTYRLYVGGAIEHKESFHAPNYCMPSQGWEMIEQNTAPLRGVGDDSAQMRRLVLQLGNQRMLVYYWFQAGKRISESDLEVRWFRAKDRLLGAPLTPTVIVTLYVPVVDTLEKAEDGAGRFLDELGPHLKRAFVFGG